MAPRIRTVEGSCWECKKRRIVCDLMRPGCHKCLKTGKRCQYGGQILRWTNSVALRGNSGGMQIPFLPSPVLKKTNDRYIIYFKDKLLPQFNLTNTIPEINPNILSMDPIFQSIIVITNTHQTHQSAKNEKAPSPSNIQDRNHALRTLGAHLTKSHTDESYNSLFITIVLSCMLDGIIEPTESRAIDNYIEPTASRAIDNHIKPTASRAIDNHIVGGRVILEQWAATRKLFQLKDKMLLFILSIFATMDLIRALLIGDKPYFDAASWREFAGFEPWWGNVPEDDDFIEIISLFSQLATTTHELRNTRSTAPVELLALIKDTINHQAIRQQKVDKTSDKAAWMNFCACYRLTASIYLYRVLESLDVDDVFVQKEVSDFIKIVNGHNLTGKLQYHILFPVLVVGSHCLKSSQRVEIRISLAETAKHLSFEAIRFLEAFLEKRWKELDESSEVKKWIWWEFFDGIALYLF